MKKILRINMGDESMDFQDVPERYAPTGGRGLIAKVLMEEVDPACAPLGPQNKLIFCPGLFGDTAAPCSGRLSVGAKSPLTGGIKEANAGGTFATQLVNLGLKAVIIEGKPDGDDWFLLSINDQGVEFLSAKKYLGLNNYQLVENLHNDFGNDYAIASVGCAGERGYRNSTIQITDPEGRPSRAAARGGLGSVMGSKRIKAILVKNIKAPSYQYADTAQFREANKAYTQGILQNPISGQAMPALGTAVLVGMINGMGILPTRNFSSGRFDQAEQISGEHIAELQAQRGGTMKHACHKGCVIHCSNVINDADGNYLTSGFEYETIGLIGANCEIGDIDAIAKIDHMCDDLGVDTMDAGCTLGVCMEAGKIEFGDAKGAIALMQEMYDGTEFGRILGDGTETAGKHLNVKRIPTVKGQALAAYDPRGLKGLGVTYATSPMGADHTAGNSLGNPTVNALMKDGQVELSTNLQVAMTLFDILGMCVFAGFCLEVPENMGHLINMAAGKFGGEWDVNRLMGLGVQSLALEKAFNKLAGFTAKDDRLPDFFYTEKLDSTDTVFDVSDEELAGAIPF